MKREYDIIAYVVIALLLILWGIQIRATCEELGCLAIVLPITGFMIVNGIEFLVNVFLLVRRKKFSSARQAVFVIGGIVSLLSLAMIVMSWLD